MGKFIAIIAIAAAAWFYTGGEMPGSSSPKAVDANGNPIVLVFTIADCKKPCKSAIKQLKKRGVPFKEVKVNPINREDENTALWKKMGQFGFPFIISGTEKTTDSSRAAVGKLLAANYGDRYMTKSEKRYYSKHFYSDGTPKIVIYSADWCPYCKKLRAELKADKTDFLEIFVEKRNDEKKLSKVMGIYGFPTTWVGYTPVYGPTLKDVKEAIDKS